MIKPAFTANYLTHLDDESKTIEDEPENNHEFKVETIKIPDFINLYIAYLRLNSTEYNDIYSKYLQIIQNNIILSLSDGIYSSIDETFIKIQNGVNALINKNHATHTFKYADGENTKKEIFLANVEHSDTDAFTRKTIISLPSFSDSRFVKCSTLIYLNSRSLNDLTFAFIHEIVMQMYAYDNKPEDDSIDIPQIHSYGIFLVNDNYYMYIEMDKFNINDTVTKHNDCYVELLAYVKYHLKIETINKYNKNNKKYKESKENTLKSSSRGRSRSRGRGRSLVSSRSLGGSKIKPTFLALFESETYANLEAKIQKLSEWLSGLHLIHNDAHLENILIKCNGSSIAVIDFGRTCFDIQNSNLFKTTSHSILSFTGNSESAANAKLGLKYLIQCSINKTHCDTFLNHASKIKKLGGKSTVTRGVTRRKAK